MKRLILVNTCTHRLTKRDSKEKLDELFKPYIPKKYMDYYTPEWMYPFEEDSPHIQALLDFADKHMIPCNLLPKIYFTKTEIDKMPFFEMRLPDPLELEGAVPADFGTKYKDRCESCGFWAESVDEILIDRKFMKKWKIASSGGHFFLSDDVCNIFDMNGLAGIHYIGNVKDYKDREMSPFKLFESTNILPPISPTMNLTSYGHPCEKCGFDIKYLRQPLEYEKGKLNGALDFNFTYEYFNNDKARVLVVSSKVKKICRENKIFAVFKPILLLD
jgi:hypothetical protein